MPVALLPVILQLVAAGIAVAPSILAAAKIELDLIGGALLTAEEKDQIDEALEAANDALQRAQPAP